MKTLNQKFRDSAKLAKADYDTHYNKQPFIEKLREMFANMTSWRNIKANSKRKSKI